MLDSVSFGNADRFVDICGVVKVENLKSLSWNSVGNLTIVNLVVSVGKIVKNIESQKASLKSSVWVLTKILHDKSWSLKKVNSSIDKLLCLLKHSSSHDLTWDFSLHSIVIHFMNVSLAFMHFVHSEAFHSAPPRYRLRSASSPTSAIHIVPESMSSWVTKHNCNRKVEISIALLWG